MKQELRNSICSLWFLIACGVMLIVFLSMSIPEWLMSADWGDENRSSALQLAIMPIYFGGVMLLFPFCACTVSAHMQVSEISTNFMLWKLLRGNRRRYVFQKLAGNFIASGFAVALAFILHALIWMCIAWPSQPDVYAMHEIPYAEGTIYAPLLAIAHGWLLLLWKACAIFFMAGIWATVGMGISVWITDRLLTVSIPTFLYFLWNSQASSLLGYRLPHAARLYNDQLTWAGAGEAFIVNILWMLIWIVIYDIGLKRKMANG